MLVSNPALVFDSGVIPVVANAIHSVPAPACVRLEPAFIFETCVLTIGWWNENEIELYRESYSVSRETIALHIGVPRVVGRGTFRFTASCDGRDLLTFNVECIGRTSFVSSAAMIGNTRRWHSLVRDRALNLGFGEMLEQADRLKTANASRLICVTGSVGKTTTKELIAHVLRTHEPRVYQTTDSWNFTHEICAQIIINAPWVRWFVSEMAIGEHLPEVGRLLPPDIFLFTHLGYVHTEQFPDCCEIGRLKASLATHVPNNGTIVFNADVPLIERCILDALGERKKLVNCVGYSAQRNPLATVVAESRSEGRSISLIRHGEHDLNVSLEGCRLHPGTVAAAYVVAKAAGVSDMEFVRAARSFHGVPGRLEECYVGHKLLINDAYNANPVSMRSFLDAVKKYAQKGLAVCVILGEMADLGERTVEEHISLASEAKDLFATLFLVGRTFERLGYVGSRWCKCVNGADHFNGEGVLNILVQEHDVIAVKGSYCTGLFFLASDTLKVMRARVEAENVESLRRS